MSMYLDYIWASIWRPDVPDLEESLLHWLNPFLASQPRPRHIFTFLLKLKA